MMKTKFYIDFQLTEMYPNKIFYYKRIIKHCLLAIGQLTCTKLATFTIQIKVLGSFFTVLFYTRNKQLEFFRGEFILKAK